jgi:MFS family permease
MDDHLTTLAPGPAPAAAGALARAARPIGRIYACYALGLLTVANFFNYVDRQIVAIVAQAIKHDLHLTDAQLGFLLGTAFAVLYGVVGIAIGRISDAVSRTRLMAAGLALWSTMTAASGASTSFAGLGAARVGVGIGEAAANPCSHSLLSDYFPQRNRAAVMGIYLFGTYLGGAASLLIGGLIVQHWPDVCRSVPVGGACGLAGWQAAFLIVGLPGLLIAVLIAGLREPPRPPKPDALPLGKLVAAELSAAVPPFTLFNLARVGGRPAALKNLALMAVLVAGAAVIGKATGDWAQWIAVAVGAYSVTTWGQVLSHRDRPLFKLTFGCPTFALAMTGGALVACVTGTIHVWAVPYAIRELGVPAGKLGLFLGLASAASGALASILGGLITDAWKRRDRRAPLWMATIAVVAPTPFLFVMTRTTDFGLFVAGYFAYGLFAMCWSGAFAALVQDLVLPRMRGTASAAFALVIILVASGVGPYWAGKISTVTGSLTTGLYSLMLLAPFAVLMLALAAARLKHVTPEARRERAAAAGEVLA